MAIRTWIPAASAAVAGAVFVIILLLPVPARGPIGNGAAFVFATYAEALAVFGLGAALSLASRQAAGSGVLLFAAGLLVGWAVKDRVLAALVQHPGMFEHTAFVGPVSCVLSGVALAVPGSRRGAVAPVVAAPVGLAIGFVAALNDPTLGESPFFAGAAMAAFWLLLAPLALLPSLDATYVATGGRVLASWLIAVGLMLGAAEAVGERSAPAPAAHFSAP